MTLTEIPAFSDNYFWLLHDEVQALVVDPGDAQPVIDALNAKALTLHAILLTHHHADHVGGVAQLRTLYPKAVVYGPAFEAIDGIDVRLSGGQSVALLGLELDVIDVPGHTSGHIAYFCPAAPFESGVRPVLFCGDTLFSAGCGRLFEGTPAQMHASLASLAALPGNTHVCCAHEYTIGNLRFAQAVEPHNADIAEHIAMCQQLRALGRPTLPSTIEVEQRINPFLRSHVPAVQASARQRDATADTEVSIFAVLRQWKNNFS